MEHRGIEYQIKIGITKHEWAWSIRTSPPSRARLVALGMTPSTLLSEPSNNGATNTPMTADRQTDRPPEVSGPLPCDQGNFSGARQVPGLGTGSSMAADEYRRNAIEAYGSQVKRLPPAAGSC